MVKAIQAGGTAGSWPGLTACKGMGLDLLGTGSPLGLNSFSALAPVLNVMDLQRKEGKKTPEACSL